MLTDRMKPRFLEKTDNLTWFGNCSFFGFQSAHSAGVGTLCDVVMLKINLNLRGLSFSHGSGALKSCTLTVKLIPETLVEEFEVVSLGVTVMLEHRIKGSRTLDAFHRFRQLRLLVPTGWNVGNLLKVSRHSKLGNVVQGERFLL